MSSKRDRPYIIDSADGSEVPYLRGIMTRSLQKAGLSFDKAYEVADEIREDLNERGDVTNDELRDTVFRLLKKKGLKTAHDRYTSGPWISPLSP